MITDHMGADAGLGFYILAYTYCDLLLQIRGLPTGMGAYWLVWIAGLLIAMWEKKNRFFFESVMT